jgi:hypothetical protein
MVIGGAMPGQEQINLGDPETVRWGTGSAVRKSFAFRLKFPYRDVMIKMPGLYSPAVSGTVLLITGLVISEK